MQVLDSLHSTYQPYEDKFILASHHNDKIIAEVEQWVDKAKNQLDEYTTKISENPLYIDFNMIESAKDQPK